MTVPEATAPAGTLGLAATAATLAELLRGDSVVTDRGVTLDDLAVDTEALVEAEVPGADELATMVESARTVTG